MDKDLGLEALSKNLELSCPNCGKIRKFSSRQYFYKARKHNKLCKSCSNSIQLGGKGVVINENNEKCCFDCNIYKSLNDFYNNSKGNKSSICKQCSHNRSKNYNRKIGKFSRYGITKEDYDLMLLEQNNQCAICKNILDKEIHIDHCHKNIKVRGILCGKCNKGLGQFNDNIEYLTNAINYLTK